MHIIRLLLYLTVFFGMKLSGRPLCKQNLPVRSQRIVPQALHRFQRSSPQHVRNRPELFQQQLTDFSTQGQDTLAHQVPLEVISLSRIMKHCCLDAEFEPGFR